jgi:hypothetical protein
MSNRRHGSSRTGLIATGSGRIRMRRDSKQTLILEFTVSTPAVLARQSHRPPVPDLDVAVSICASSGGDRLNAGRTGGCGDVTVPSKWTRLSAHFGRNDPGTKLSESAVCLHHNIVAFSEAVLAALQGDGLVGGAARPSDARRLSLRLSCLTSQDKTGE